MKWSVAEFVLFLNIILYRDFLLFNYHFLWVLPKNIKVQKTKKAIGRVQPCAKSNTQKYRINQYILCHNSKLYFQLKRINIAYIIVLIFIFILNTTQPHNHILYLLIFIELFSMNFVVKYRDVRAKVFWKSGPAQLVENRHF